MRDKKEKEKKEGRFSRFLRYTDVSFCAFTDYKIEIEKSNCRGEKCLIAYGSSGIRTLTRERVALDYGEEYLVVCGRHLDFHAYADGAMNIRGVFHSVSFCKREAYFDENP